MSTSNLDSFVHRTRPLPVAKATSQEVRDRGSTFVANIFRATTPEEAKAAINHLKNVIHAAKPANHEIYAWRCMVLKQGQTGLGGPDDFVLNSSTDDDGERWAGGRILKVMESQAVIDAVVIVSRWYGGIMLGPARFTHIETCTTEVCRAFKVKEELEECVSILPTLDNILAQLREELAELSTAAGNPPSAAGSTRKPPDYASWTESDLPKAKKLVVAREKAIATVKNMIAKQREVTESSGQA